MNADDASVVSFTFLQLQVLLEHSISHLFGHHLLDHYAHTHDTSARAHTRQSTRSRHLFATKRDDAL